MSISTRAGDDGETRLFSGEKVSKDHPRPSAYGELDEAVSAMGLGRALSRNERIRATLRTIQRRCFAAGAELATVGAKRDSLPDRLSPSDVEVLDRLVTELEGKVDLPPVFVIPGGTPASAAIDLARGVVRRAERAVVGIVREGPEGTIPDPVIPFLNRLSDVLFLLARLEEQSEGVAYDRLRDAPGASETDP